MRFKDFLKEGMIVNPPKLLKDITDFVIYSYLAYVKDKIEEHFEGKEYNAALQVLKHVCGKNKLPFPTDVYSHKAGKAKILEHEFKLDFSDLPTRYLDKLKKLGTDVSKLHDYDAVIAEVDFQERSSISGSGEFNANTLTMTFGLAKAYMLIDENTNLAQIHEILFDRVPHLIGIIDHETAHMTQFLVLKRFHEYNVKHNYIHGEVGDDYYLSPVEFDPTIRSEAAYFRGVEEVSKEFGLKEYDKNQALQHFTYADGTENPSFDDIERISFTRRSPFFGVLKRRDPVRWKKAIKLISQMV